MSTEEELLREILVLARILGYASVEVYNLQPGADIATRLGGAVMLNDGRRQWLRATAASSTVEGRHIPLTGGAGRFRELLSQYAMALGTVRPAYHKEGASNIDINLLTGKVTRS